MAGGKQKKTEWTSHGESVKDCYQIWYAMIGANVPTLGEVKSKEQVYQKDLIHQAAKAIGVNFKSEVK